jgi:NADH:ubiquinone oxidoreductase subunit F (NADH-binding)
MPEKRIVLKNCEVIDPGDVDSYLEHDGFKALSLALGMSPEAVIAEVKASGLRGRGGAGFSCGLKWELANKTPGDTRYLICNADEGEVGTFKDGYILKHDPFTLIEAMAIAAYAIRAKQAFIYLRAEYHYLLDGLVDAIDQVKAKGLLTHLNIEICEGAGAYICADGFDRGQTGRSPLQAAIPAQQGSVGQANHYQQRRNIDEYPGDPA